jgi:hypothetical protein
MQNHKPSNDRRIDSNFLDHSEGFMFDESIGSSKESVSIRTIALALEFFVITY